MTESTDIVKPKREIIKPGWHKDISNEDYHGGYGTSSSNLKIFLEKTAAHYHYEKTHYVDHQTDTKDLGTAFHTLTLEPHKFDEDIVVRPASIKQRRGKEWEAFRADAGSRTIITVEQHNKALAMAARVREHPIAGILVEDLIVESSIYWWYKNPNRWDEEDTNDYKELMKCRPDGLTKSHPLAIDLKSAVGGGFTDFMKAMHNYWYHVSGAMYLEGINQCEELLKELHHFAIIGFIFIVCENEPPFEVSLYKLSQKDREFGSTLYHRAVRNLHEGRQLEWPGYDETIRDTDLPPWAERGNII